MIIVSATSGGPLRLLVAIAVAVAAAASLAACGVRSHMETFVPGALGYRGHVYLGFDSLPVHLEHGSATPVPEGFASVGQAVVLGGGLHGIYVSERGWKVPVYSIAGQPERIASPNSWGGGNVYYNEYELSPQAKWKR